MYKNIKFYDERKPFGISAGVLGSRNNKGKRYAHIKT